MIPIEINDSGEIYATLQGQPVRIFAKAEPGRYAFMIRAVSCDVYLAAALQVGLLVHQNPAQDAILDSEGNELFPAVEASGPLVPRSGTVITELGEMTLTPAVLDENGNVVTPAVTDGRHHVNFWLDQEAWERQQWLEFALGWALNGQPGNPNHEETSLALSGIELIDPLTVTSPSNIML
jgi:hypothetical protein